VRGHANSFLLDRDGKRPSLRKIELVLGAFSSARPACLVMVRPMQRPLTLILFCTSLAVVACSSGDDDDDTAVSDAAPADAADQPDAMVAASAIGQTCMPADPASCPDDYACLNVEGGTNAWCSKTCTTPMNIDPACSAGYDGPGLPGCFLSGGGMNYCGVVCVAPAEACPACDGTCPGSLVCGTPNEMGVAFCL
jgi:hypothetical protein